MLIRLCALFLIAATVLRGQEQDQDWEIAVVINDEIDLFSSNGSKIGLREQNSQNFTKLKALTFDNVRHQFVVSDMDQKKVDTIFTVQLTKETDITPIVPIVEGLPDDVQGLAIDPITDVLYWTDSSSRTISYLNLSDPYATSQILFSLPEQQPYGVTVDVCRRHIYWTNSNSDRPSIERADLDGTHRKTLVSSDLHRPRGIAVDHKNQRLYWADVREGIVSRIESSNLEGKERELIHEGKYSVPFGVAVDTDAIYWTDATDMGLWKISKKTTMEQRTPQKIHDFRHQGIPKGIVTKNMQISSLPDCDNLDEALKAPNDSNDDEIARNPCLNGGHLEDSGDCKCPRGFNGSTCEFHSYSNFCLQGRFYFAQNGSPMCRCSVGFSGKRCEKDQCDGFCLNGGICSPDSNDLVPTCTCQKNFVGVRCEVSARSVDICKVFCEQPENEDLSLESEEFQCRCNKGSLFTFSSSNGTMAEPSMLMNSSEENLYRLGDPVFLVLSSGVVILLVLVIVLSFFACGRRKPRPTRVKRRIIVNKNVTPLTYRPQPTTEQCEITIENCCNMNVCETPCFDPPQLRNFQAKPDDKKNLLSNMENGEDLY